MTKLRTQNSNESFLIENYIISWAGENNRVGIRQHRRRRLLVRLKGKVNDVKDKVIDRAGLTDSPNHMTLDLYIS
jgi:hypothetical protein